MANSETKARGAELDLAKSSVDIGKYHIELLDDSKVHISHECGEAMVIDVDDLEKAIAEFWDKNF